MIIVWLAGQLGSVGAFTRSHSHGHSAVEVGQLAARAYFELGTVDAHQERNDETGRPIERVANRCVSAIVRGEGRG